MLHSHHPQRSFAEPASRVPRVPEQSTDIARVSSWMLATLSASRPADHACWWYPTQALAGQMNGIVARWLGLVTAAHTKNDNAVQHVHVYTILAQACKLMRRVVVLHNAKNISSWFKPRNMRDALQAPDRRPVLRSGR
jgi:hypothetical protein